MLLLLIPRNSPGNAWKTRGPRATEEQVAPSGPLPVDAQPSLRRGNDGAAAAHPRQAVEYLYPEIETPSRPPTFIVLNWDGVTSTTYPPRAPGEGSSARGWGRPHEAGASGLTGSANRGSCRAQQECGSF